MINLKIRNTMSNDYTKICELGSQCYSKNYYEDDKSFISKIEGCYEGCLVADVDGIIGYIISFPYKLGKIHPINCKFKEEPGPNCWYIHDICVIEEFRKKGVGKELANSIIKNYNVICLTSLVNSELFWKKLGFRSFFETEYCGDKAKYMMLIK